MKLLRYIFPLAVILLVYPAKAQKETDASLVVEFANGTTVFHVGEIIPIELTFSASMPGKFDMEQRNYDRSGRLNIERFQVTPAGRDPLEKYYSIGGFMMGGLGGPRELTTEPRVMREDLNEWVALDKPGHYSVYVTSGRVSHRGATKSEPMELQSNTLDFEVLAADAAWQQQVFASAMATLNIESSTPQEKAAAWRTLRFLDTPAALHELVKLLGTHSEGDKWNEVAGLAGSQYQSLVVQELEQQMNEPGIGLRTDYLFILAKLKFQLDHDPLPPYPQKDIEQGKVWEKERRIRDKELGELQDTLYETAAALVASKEGLARAITVQTLLQRPESTHDDIKPLAGLPPEEIASAFLKLSEDEQWGLLFTFWNRLKVPAMVASLEKVAQQPNMQHQQLRDMALRRLFDLDPGEATSIFMDEIKHPHLDNRMFPVKGETLGLLPNETLPQFDQMLSDRLGDKESRTNDLDAQLLGRYSTKAILPTVKAIYERSPGRWDCVTEDGFILYFLRVDPDYGVKRMEVDHGRCMTNSLHAVIRMNRWKDVEPGIIAGLNGSDLNVGRDAAETLAKYGGPEDKKVLWERLRRFHEQWADHESDLNDRPGMRPAANEAMGFQFGLVEAIGSAQAWLLANEEITALEGLTLGQERDNVKSWHWNSPVDLNVTCYEAIFQASVAHYVLPDLEALQRKLAQFPEGTGFTLSISGSPEHVAETMEAINDVAAEHAFQLERHPPDE